MWLKAKIAASLDPERVGATLDAIAAQWPGSLEKFLRGFPIGVEPLIHLIAVSTICAERLQQDAELLHWLAQPEISAADRGPRRMVAELDRFTDSPAQNNFAALRQWKAREMTRIALREVAEIASLEQTTAELSWLAEVCLATVYQHLTTAMRARFGDPQTDFAALGLGKLGGHELNHSSDIDLIFLYGEEGEVSPRLTRHEWHNRLAEEIVKVFAKPGLWRVDLRLRPEGSAGPLTRSIESMENYYAGFGETWERLALIKGRRVCGSDELAYEFLRQHQPFIFPRSATPELLSEISAIKRRIEREVPHETLNVKLGAGGIREIEFIVQTLQFIHGARHPFLQETSTLKTLAALYQLELLPLSEVRALDHAYRLLRRIEHRLQIEAERQTHSIPVEPERRDRLARSLGSDSASDFLAEVRSATDRVREIFDHLIASGTAAPAVDLGLFADEQRASRALSELARGSSSFHVAPRTRHIFGKLRPLLLEQLSRCADPDATLTALVRFVEAFGLRSLLFELLATNPKLLELLVQTFDASEFAAQILIRRPQLLEETTRGTGLGEALTVSQHRSVLQKRDLRAIRSYRQAQLLRIIMRDVLSLAGDVNEELSALAEGCLLATCDALGLHDLTIVAMGKFGGNEITYGADLDLMFVGENYRAAQDLLSTLTWATPEGMIAPVDVRLRPEGEKGPLVSSLAAFESYYRQRAQLWEIQALSRARPVAGKQAAEFLRIAQEAWANAGRDRRLFAEITAMLERIRRERGSGNDFADFKTGTGGIIEAEFLVQLLQMHANVPGQNWIRATDRLVEARVLTSDNAAALRASYGFLRRCETVLRRYSNTSVSVLPGDSKQQQTLARRLGFDAMDAFTEKYTAARECIHGLYRSLSGSATDQ